MDEMVEARAADWLEWVGGHYAPAWAPGARIAGLARVPADAGQITIEGSPVVGPRAELWPGAAIFDHAVIRGRVQGQARINGWSIVGPTGAVEDAAIVVNALVYGTICDTAILLDSAYVPPGAVVSGGVLIKQAIMETIRPTQPVMYVSRVGPGGEIMEKAVRLSVVRVCLVAPGEVLMYDDDDRSRSWRTSLKRWLESPDDCPDWSEIMAPRDVLMVALQRVADREQADWPWGLSKDDWEQMKEVTRRSLG